MSNQGQFVYLVDRYKSVYVSNDFMFYVKRHLPYKIYGKAPL